MSPCAHVLYVLLLYLLQTLKVEKTTITYQSRQAASHVFAFASPLFVVRIYFSQIKVR